MKLSTRFLILVALALCWSCGAKQEQVEEEVVEEMEPDSVIVLVEGANLLPGWDEKDPIYAVDQKFSLKKNNSIKVPSIIKRQLKQAKTVETLSWQDGNGENFFGIFVQKDRKKNQTQLLAYHAADMGEGDYRILRRLLDFVEKCEFDLILDMIPGSLTVTDLDSNRYGEITFVYQLGCLSDVSPLDAKLMLLENGNKYAIRGTTSIKNGGEVMQGEKKPSTNFEEAPEALQTYANMQWDRFTDTTVYYWKQDL